MLLSSVDSYIFFLKSLADIQIEEMRFSRHCMFFPSLHALVTAEQTVEHSRISIPLFLSGLVEGELVRVRRNAFHEESPGS